MLFLLIIGASVFSTFMAISRLPDRLVEIIVDADVGTAGVLAIVVAVYLFLGCFMDSTSMMLLTLPVLLPVLHRLDVNLIWFGIIVVKLTEMGAITPPFGITVYVVKGVVGDAIPLEEIFRGIGWFLVMEFLTLLLLIFFPQISLFLPNLMLGK
jgi:TRAP-type C4-dicarboxylate transport system permease large subunit